MSPIPITIAVNTSDGDEIQRELNAKTTGISVEEVFEATHLTEGVDVTATECLATPFGAGEPTAPTIYDAVRTHYPNHPLVIVTPNDDIEFIERILSDPNSEYVYRSATGDLATGVLSAYIQRLVNG